MIKVLWRNPAEVCDSFMGTAFKLVSSHTFMPVGHHWESFEYNTSSNVQGIGK